MLKIILLTISLVSAVYAEQSLSIEQWQTNNGAKVLFVHAPMLPIVDVALSFYAGSAYDGELPGLSNLTTHLLIDGAGQLDAETIMAGFDDVGARFSLNATRDVATVGLRSLTDEKLLTPAIDLFASILKEPAFPEDALERRRQQTLAALQRHQESPGTVGQLRLFKTIYQSAAYGNAIIGDLDSVSSITKENLEAFYQQYFVASNAVMVIIGDIQQAKAKQLSEQLTSVLPKGSAAKKVDDIPAMVNAETQHIDFPSTQTHILLGHLGVSRDNDDYIPLLVGNHILGGSGFGSRLMEEVRSKRGLSYSVYSYFLPMKAKGPFLMGLQTQNEQAEEALEVVQNTLQIFVKEGPTEEELELAKRNIIGGFPLQLSSNGDIASQLMMMGLYDLPLNYLDTFTAQVNRVTTEQIQQAFEKHVLPERLVTVMVGGKPQAQQES